MADRAARPCAAQGAARFSGEDPGYKYTRLGNATVRAVEQAVTMLEETQRESARSTI